MKNFLIIITLFCALAAQACALAAHHEQHEPAIGIHGMAAFKVDNTFYASHMPLANSMLAHQIIFSFTLGVSETEQLNSMLDQHQLVSLMPSKFDLWDLMDGSIKQIEANIHANHFERGGKVALENIELEITEMLLSKPLSDTKNGQFYVLATSSTKGLLIHKIGANPSFDQILEIEFLTEGNGSKGESVMLNEGQPVDVADSLPEGLNFAINRQLYLETQDFQ